VSPQAAASPAGGQGKVAVSAVLVLIIAGALFLIVRAKPQPDAFDPRSSRADGARALVLLLRSQGAEVDTARDVPSLSSRARLLVLDDRLNDSQRESVNAYANAGGFVLVADPRSPLHGGVDDTSADKVTVPTDSVEPGFDVEADLPLADCTIDALTHLRGLYVRGAIRFAVGDGDRRCFAEDGHSFVIVKAQGAGLIVGLGDNYLFTNDLLRYADNSGLATALLTPKTGGRVVVLLGEEASKSVADVGTGDQTLSDLVRPGVWMALVQLAVAFVVVAMAKAIRSGKPVNEPRPVPVAGSELVSATSNLMQRAHHGQRAGWLLQADLYRTLCRQLRLPQTVSLADLDAAAARRYGLAPGQVNTLLTETVTDNAHLVDLSNRLQAVRRTIADHTTAKGVTV
jgi:hypothetical protein